MKKLLLLSGVVLSLFMLSCADDELNVPSFPPGTYDRTVVIYMVGENSLNRYTYINMEQIIDGLSESVAPGERYAVVIYSDPSANSAGFPETGGAPYIIELRLEPNRSVSRNVVKVYAEQDSTDPVVMNGVLEEIAGMYPSREYGLVLWGHGTGWLNNTGTPRAVSALSQPASDGPKYAFGDDNTRWTDIDELADAIPDDMFGFIMFDVCYMGGAEVVYQLRDKADYIISSPSEVLAGGYPYERLVPLFFSPALDLTEVCREFYDYYRGLSNPWATVSLVKTSQLPALAEVVGEIVTSNAAAVNALNTSSLQTFGTGGYNSYFYDLGDFMERVASPSQYAAFRAQMDRTVVYKAHTSYFSNIAINKFSGLSSYVYKGGVTARDVWYTTLDWYNTVYEN